jgi:hypothetical protein
MEAIEWTLATAVGILLLLVLMLALLATGAWLLRLICRIWNAPDHAPTTSDRDDGFRAR